MHEVNLLVQSQLGEESIGLVAAWLLAPVRVLANMGSKMFVQFVLLGEGFLAILARMGFLGGAKVTS